MNVSIESEEKEKENNSVSASNIESNSLESSSKHDQSDASEAKIVHVQLTKISSAPTEPNFSTTLELTGLAGTPPPHSPQVAIASNSERLASFKSIKSSPNLMRNFSNPPISSHSGRNALPFPKFTPIDKLTSPRRTKKTTVFSSDNEESNSEHSQESDEWFKSDD